MLLIKVLVGMAIIAMHLELNAAPAIYAENIQTRSPVNAQLIWLADPIGSFNVAQVMAFHESHWFGNKEDRRHNFGQQSAVFWLKTRIVQSAENTHPLHLQIIYPHHDYLDVYFVRNNKLLEHYETGDRRPHASRPLPSHDFVFPVPSGDSVDVYIRVKSDGVLQLRTFLMPKEELRDHAKFFFFLNGIYFGAALIMLLYNAFIYSTIRDQSYLYYLAYISASVFLQATLSGLAFQYLWPDHPAINDIAVILAAAFLTATAIGFVIKFIGLSRATTPRDFTWLIMLAASFILILGMNIFISYSIALKATFIVVTLAVCSGFYLGLKYWLKGVMAARYFALAWFVYLLFIAMYLLQSNQIIEPNFLSDNAFSLGSLIELAILSLAFADKLNEEKELRVKAQDDLLNITIRMNEELDTEVQARTEELEKANQRLKELSVTDSLTKLKNRYYFDQALKREIRRCAREKWPFAVIMLDVDHFKQLNDNYGHIFGDFCLAKAAELVQSVIQRPSDTIARYGGEEFAILLPNTTLDGAVKLAEKVREQFKETPFDDGNNNVYLTVSMGVSGTRPNPETVYKCLSILDLADQCLYKAKQTGRDRVVAERFTED